MEYTNRILLVSDMHYTTEETYGELKAIYPEAKASAAAGDAFGYTQKEKIDAVRNDLNDFCNREKVDCIFVLGDLSIDDYGYRNLPDNYCKKFKTECMDLLGCQCYAIPGNHDSYTDEQWKDIFGYGRQFSVKIGDMAFILADTFANYPAKDASGSKYTGVDTDFLKHEAEKYTGENIVVMSHYFASGETIGNIVSAIDKTVCVFDAHTHKNRLYTNGFTHINIGGYGYCGEMREDKQWYFDRFDESWAWGFEVFEWNENQAHAYHIKPARKYVGYNGTFDYKGAIEDEVFIKLK